MKPDVPGNFSDISHSGLRDLVRMCLPNGLGVLQALAQRDRGYNYRLNTGFRAPNKTLVNTLVGLGIPASLDEEGASPGEAVTGSDVQATPQPSLSLLHYTSEEMAQIAGEDEA